MGMQPVSFEFFPPANEEALQRLITAAKKLTEYNPEFFSVTYGAGGSTQDRTSNTVSTLKQTLKLPIAPHLSCVGNNKTHIEKLLEYYKTHAIDHLVVLRGDKPSGLGDTAGEFNYACDLVHCIRDMTGDYFRIDVAAYPECHPETNNLKTDMLHFKNKVDAGANNAITQYFYNAEAYYHFLNDCHKLNIDIPIIPGIMPITNYTQLARFSHMCGAEIPRWLKFRLEKYADDLEAVKAIGLEVVTKLCEQLLHYGAPSFHFYTLNKADATRKILSNLNLKT